MLLVATSTVPEVAVAEHHPVTGVYVDPRAGSVPLRQNINDLEAEAGAQW